MVVRRSGFIRVTPRPLRGAAMSQHSGKALVIIRNNGRVTARLRQLGDTNEVGWSICRFSDGKLTNGPVAEGTPFSVEIPVECPPGSELEGLFHTHPGGVAFPSDTDIRSAVRIGANTLCIDADGHLECYIVK